MPRLKMILNPAADRGHAGEIEPELKQIVAGKIATSGHPDDYEIVWTRTERPRHATELAAEAGFDVVVAIGGDGTVHEVVNGLMKFPAEMRPQLGVIPIGSGNDFAHNAGLPETAQEAARCVIGNQTRVVDAGRIVDGEGREEYWNNTIGVGFSGAVNIAGRKRTKLRGFLVYFVTVLETILFKPPALDATVTIDDGEPFEQGVSMISVCNGPREGGGFPVAPNAVLDDGLLTYMLMDKMGRLRLLRFLPVVMAANHLKYDRWFEEGTAKRVQIKTNSTMAIHTDGEVFGSWEQEIREIKVEIIPGALELLCSC